MATGIMKGADARLPASIRPPKRIKVRIASYRDIGLKRKDLPAERNSLITDEIIRVAAEMYALGCPSHRYVAGVLGVSHVTFQRWRRVGNDIVDGKQPIQSQFDADCVRLVLTIDRVRSEHARQMLRVVHSAAIDGNDPKIAAWFLERMHRFGSEEKTLANDSRDPVLRIEVDNPIDASVEQEMREIVGRYRCGKLDASSCADALCDAFDRLLPDLSSINKTRTRSVSES